MNKLFLLTAIGFYILSISCTKMESSGHGGYPQTPSYEKAPGVPVDTNSVWGVMLNTRKSYYYREYRPGEEAWAWFYDSIHGGYLPMDIVNFNGHNGNEICYWPSGVPMPIYPPHLYHAIGGGCTDYHLDSSVLWQAANDSAEISIVYNFTNAFPHYTDSIPSIAKASSGLTLRFDSTTVMNADSVQVTIENNWGTNPQRLIDKTFSAHTGVLTIDFSSIMSPGTDGLTVTLTLFTYRVVPFKGRDYAFVKEDIIECTVHSTE